MKCDCWPSLFPHEKERKCEWVCVCVYCQGWEATQRISASILSLYPIHFLSLLLLPRSHCPDSPVSAPLSLSSFSVHLASHTLAALLSHPTFSHLLTFFIYPSPFLLSARSPSPDHSSAPISALIHSIPSLTPIYSTTLPPLPIIRLFSPIFFLSLRGPLGFRALSLPSLWFRRIGLSFYERIWNKMCFWALHFFPLIWLHPSHSLSLFQPL